MKSISRGNGFSVREAYGVDGIHLRASEDDFIFGNIFSCLFIQKKNIEDSRGAFFERIPLSTVHHIS